MGLPEQTQRRAYSSASSALRRGGGVVKNFRWEGEPQRKFENTTTTALRTLFGHSNRTEHIPSASPLPPTNTYEHGTHIRYARDTTDSRLCPRSMWHSHPNT